MRQVRPSHPLCRRFHQSFLESFSLGTTVCGHLTDYRFETEANTWVIYWDYELNYGVDKNDCSIFIFVNGKFFDSVPVDSSPYVYTMPRSRKKVTYDMYILPSSAEYQYLPYGLWDQVESRVKLRWKQNGVVNGVKVYGNKGPTPTKLLKTITRTKAYNDSSENTELNVFGDWNLDTVRHAEITVTVDEYYELNECYTGYVDYSDDTRGVKCSYNCAETGDSGTIRISDKSVHLLNGLYVTLDYGVYIPGDNWKIKVSVVNTYTTQPLPDGTYSFKVNTLNDFGQETDLGGALHPVVVNTPPEPPVFISTSYTDGTGTASFTIKTPADESVTGFRLYRNEAWNSLNIIDWQPVLETAAVQNTQYTIGPISDLVSGVNNFTVNTIDSTGKESMDLFITVELDDDLNLLDNEPEPPYSIEAEVLSNGKIKLTSYVPDATTQVNFYRIEGGASFYSPIGSVTGLNNTSDYNEVNVLYTPAATDLYVFGARCMVGERMEYNTHITVEIYAAIDPAQNVSDITYEVIE